MVGGRELTIFCVDVSPSMRESRTVIEMNESNEGEVEKVLSQLDYGLEVARSKVSSMLLSGLKTVHCGIVLFGSAKTKNSLSDQGYKYIWEYSHPNQPSFLTLSKINDINRYLTDFEKDDKGDILSALIFCNHLIGETLGKKKWTRKIVLITDAKSKTDWNGIKDERTKMRADDVELTVIGIDFDDPGIGYSEPFKSEIKAENELKLHKLCRSIGNSSRCETAVFSVLSAQQPQPRIVGSTPRPVTLTLGYPDPERAKDEGYDPEETLRIECFLKKCTSIVRPMASKKIGRVALKSEQARQKKNSLIPSLKGGTLEQFLAVQPDDDNEEEEDQLPSGLIQPERKYVYVEKGNGKGNEDGNGSDGNDSNIDEDESSELELREAPAERLVKAYKYGNTRVIIDNEDEERIRKTFSPSLQINGFVKLSKVPRHHYMNDVNYLYADPEDPESQMTISAIVRVMENENRAGLARFVGTLGSSEPKMVVLIPVVEPNIRYFLFIQVPFAEDLRDYFFPPLQGMRTAEGKSLVTQRHTPTDEMQAAMDELVDNMELVEETVEEEDGESVSVTRPWFVLEEAFSPSVHHLRNCILYRLSHPDSENLPAIHPSLKRYLDQPDEIVKRSSSSLEKVKWLMELKPAPAQVKRSRLKKDKKDWNGENDTIDLDEILGTSNESDNFESSNLIPTQTLT